MKPESLKLLVLFIVIISGCNDQKFGTKIINIVSLETPETGTVNNPINIQVRAQANNGCYFNLRVSFNRVTKTHYELLAAADYDMDASACPAVIVNLDTTISFTPTQAGTYYITANHPPNILLRDTISVK